MPFELNGLIYGGDQRDVSFFAIFLGEKQSLLDAPSRRCKAKKTPLHTFKDNTAHSNGNMGLGFFRRLDVDHGIIGCSTYTPSVDPSSNKSELVPILFDGFIGKKCLS